MAIAEVQETWGAFPGLNHQEIADARDALREAILDACEWRKRKAAEHPNDARNTAAAELLGAVATSVDEVPDALMIQYAEAWHDEFAFRTSEAQSVLLQETGFRSAINSATKLIENVLEHVAAARADHAQS